MGAFAIALIVLVLTAWFTRNRVTFAVSLALAANWLVNSIVCYATDLAYPYVWFMVCDYATGIAIILIAPMWIGRAPSKWQIAVTLIYSAQLIWHVFYMWSSQDAWWNYYSWYFLSRTAWLQLLIAGAWCAAELLRHVPWFVGFVSASKALFQARKEHGDA